MTRALIIGDGPGGLSAALFLAKNGVEPIVIGSNDTPMHKALLLNYLGVPRVTGTDFMAEARKQVLAIGAEIHDLEVQSLSRDGERFVARCADGKTFDGKYVIIASGDKKLAEAIGVDLGAAPNLDMCTNVERAYLLGWLVRKKKIQAITSAGDGAAAALHILSAEKGADFHDFDLV